MPIKHDRTHLVARLDRWESTYGSASIDEQLTNQAGVRNECFAAIESLLRDCHSLLQEICGKAADYSLRKGFDALTLGDRIRVLEEIEPACRFALQRLRRDIPIKSSLISSEDFKLLRGFNEVRKDNVHRDGRSHVSKVIRLTRSVSSLPFFDICQQLEFSKPRV